MCFVDFAMCFPLMKKGAAPDTSPYLPQGQQHTQHNIMKKNKILTAFAVSTAAMLASANAANVIAVNFIRTVTNTPAANDGSEFGISTWVDVLSGDKALTTDGVSFAWDGGTWSAGGAPNNIYTTYVDNATDFTLTGLAAWLTTEGATSYTVQVIQASDTASQTFGDVLIKDTDGSGSLLETLAGGTQQKFSTVTSSGSFNADTLFIDPTNTNGNRTSVAGIIITAVPEPSSTVLLGLGGLTLILRRRK